MDVDLVEDMEDREMAATSTVSIGTTTISEARTVVQEMQMLVEEVTIELVTSRISSSKDFSRSGDLLCLCALCGEAVARLSFRFHFRIGD